MSEQQKPVAYTKYSYAGKEPIEDMIKESFPKQLIPSKRINAYFGIIFLIVLIIAFIQFPYGSLASGNTEITIGVGYPLHFLEFNLMDVEANPLIFGGLVLDLILYLFIAYVIDIVINLILRNPLLMDKKDLKNQPKIFEDRNPKTVAEKLTNKIIKKSYS